jgi:hypothetical protein
MTEFKEIAKTRALTDDEKSFFCKTKELRKTPETAPKMEFIREDNISLADLEDLNRDLWEERNKTERLVDFFDEKIFESFGKSLDAALDSYIEDNFPQYPKS